MPYRFATERQDYSDYAAGRVFYAFPGHPAFPVRLASEIFQMCMAIRAAWRLTSPCTLYDPCCGGAYHLSTLAYLHWPAIREIIGSDIDAQIIAVARRNLALLTMDGLHQRMQEIATMLTAYGKASHATALASARALRSTLRKFAKTHALQTRVFRADAADRQALRANLSPGAIDVVLTDIPYGHRSTWQGSVSASVAALNPAWSMLNALRGVLAPGSLVAIASDKSQRITHEQYQRLEHFRLGKRQVVLLTPEHAEC